MIFIGERIQPFSHKEGTQCVIPGTDLILEAFPHRLRVGLQEIPLQGEPFQRPFTVQQDLETQCVKIFGDGFQMKVFASPQGVVCKNQKTKEEICVPWTKGFEKKHSLERLSLGSHKKQDWDFILRRMDLKEILPVLYRLSQTMGDVGENPLDVPKRTEKQLLTWICSSFQHMLVPKVAGRIWEETFWQIRSLFLQEEGKEIQLFPGENLFPEGRFLGAKTFFGQIDFEWTKGKMRRVHLHVEKDTEVLLSGFSSCRIKRLLHERGKTVDLKNPLVVVKSEKVFLDRFISNREN